MTDFNKTTINLICEKFIVKFFDRYKHDISLIAKFKNSFLELNYKINKTYENMDKLAILLDKQCYAIPLNLSIPTLNNLADYVASIENNKDYKKEIDKIMLKLIKKDNWKYIEKLLDGFVKNKSLPSERMEILKSCLAILRNNSMKNASNVIIPTLFAQIDGIWQDMFDKNLNKKAGLREMVQNAKSEYDKSCSKILIEKLFKYTKESKEAEDFCRNKVMHGEQLSYGNIFNVIKAFLLIEFLVFMKVNKTKLSP